MLIKEYRIALPMSVEEYRIAQLYMIQVGTIFLSYFAVESCCYELFSNRHLFLKIHFQMEWVDLWQLLYVIVLRWDVTVYFYSLLVVRSKLTTLRQDLQDQKFDCCHHHHGFASRTKIKKSKQHIQLNYHRIKDITYKELSPAANNAETTDWWSWQQPVKALCKWRLLSCDN